MYSKQQLRCILTNISLFHIPIEGMKDAWKRGMKASAGYYNRMSQYNKDTRGMTKEERNNYYRDRNKEDGWFDENTK